MGNMINYLSKQNKCIRLPLFEPSKDNLKISDRNKILETETRLNDKIDKKMKKVDNIIKDEE